MNALTNPQQFYKEQREDMQGQGMREPEINLVLAELSKAIEILGSRTGHLKQRLLRVSRSEPRSDAKPLLETRQYSSQLAAEFDERIRQLNAISVELEITTNQIEI